jgi:hypothetical protein
MFKRAIITMSSLVVFAFGTLAQTQAPHQHNAATMIDGAVHPELIPDSVAYRLYFIAVAEDPQPTAPQKTRQHAHLRAAGLSEADISSTALILANFKTQYAALIATYNESQEVQNNTNDGLAAFLLQREQLVQATRDALTASLTPAGMTKFDARIHTEKSKMQVASQEAGQ